ncbi:OsmC family protein [Rhodohalobacter sp. 8-1]|uniref:OsmC family protein n=1 Tax=Rhodohalobacter sp. 8-1 TaxID=3131972 RepID=UPI0030EB6C98
MTTSDKKKIVHIHIGTQNYKTSLTAGNHELTADEPQSVGGQDTGPDPYDYLLMSLGSCTAITLRMYIERKKWKVDDIYVELRHFKDHAEDCEDCDEESAKIDKIEEEIIVKGDLSDEQLDKLLEISHKCPVYKTLQGSVDAKASITMH